MAGEVLASSDGAVAQSLGEALLYSTMDALVAIDGSGRVRLFNPAAERMFGIPAAEIVGRSLDSIIPARAREGHRLLVRRVIGKSPHPRMAVALGEMWGVRADGEEFPIEASLLEMRVGGQRWFVRVLRDTTKRKRAEAALAASEQRFRSLTENSSEIINLLDGSGRIVYENPRSFRTLGYSCGELLGRDAFDLLHPEDRPRATQMFADLLREPGGTRQLEARVRTKTGGWRVGEILAKNLLHDPAVRGVILNTRDITERRRAQEELKKAHDLLEQRVRERTAELSAYAQALTETEERYRQLFQTTADAILVVDLKANRIVDSNKAAQRMFGYSREELLQMSHLQLSAEPERSLAALKEAIAGKISHVPLRYYRKKDGAVFPVEISGSIFKVRGRLMLCGLMRDISDQIFLQREILSISEREQRRLGQDLHDDLCQQLAGIEFLSQTLAGDLGKSSKGGLQAGEIARMVRRAMGRTRELARGLVPVSLRAEGLAPALQELAALTRKVFKVDCRFKAQGSIPGLDPAAAVHLYRITQEAIGNAIKHGNARRITLWLTTEHAMLLLRVRDNGSGLPAKWARSRGLGLQMMQYRVAVLGGALSIRRAPRGGTLVECRVDPELARLTTLGRSDPV